MGRNKSRKSEPPSRTKLKKDPGVPRLPDLKEKAKRDAERSARNAQRHGHTGAALPLATDITMNTDGPRTLASSLSSLLPSSSLHHESHDILEGEKPLEAARKHFHKHLHSVLSQSDILLLVLDARDPLGCISPSLTALLQSTSNSSSTPKQLIYVLNKVDLVPSETVRAWLRHLRHTTPTLPFKAQRETGAQNNATVSALMRLIKAYRPGGPKQTLTVGVVGFPNVGKSSIINALKRSKVCSTSPLAGHTTSLQSISLEKSLKIIDSPGVIFDDPSSSSSQSTFLLLRNVLRPTSIPDPISLIPSILQLASAPTLQRIYNLPEFTDAQEMLTMIALQSGKLSKGGAPDLEAAARMILGDWSAQKIPWWTTPPEVHAAFVPSTVQIRAGVGEEGEAGVQTVVAPGAENVGQAQILQTLGKAFELEGLYGSADSALDGTGNDEDMGIYDPPPEDEEQSMDGIDAQDGVGVPMESDDLLSLVPRKRSLSPTGSHVLDTATMGNPSTPNTPRKKREEKSWQSRQPKRLRKEVAREEAGHHTVGEAMGAVSMKEREKEKKREAKRRAKKGRRIFGNSAGGGEGEMEVDDL